MASDTARTLADVREIKNRAGAMRKRIVPRPHADVTPEGVTRYQQYRLLREYADLLGQVIEIAERLG